MPAPDLLLLGIRGLTQIRLGEWQNIDMDKAEGVMNWLRRIRDVVLMALVWAAVWGPIGVLTGLIVDPDGSMDEMWVAVGAYPGFLCGAVFSVLIGTSKSAGRLENLSFPRVAIRGAASGLLVGVFPFALLASNDAEGIRGWPPGVLVIASFTLLSAASAAGSVKLAKWWARRGRSKRRRM